jgi:hypothetical protein
MTLAEINDHVPAPVIIIGPAEIIDLIRITKWAFWVGAISGARGIKAQRKAWAPVGNL